MYSSTRIFPQRPLRWRAKPEEVARIETEAATAEYSRMMETAHDGEVNDDLPITVTGSSSSRAADTVITVAAKCVDQPPITIPESTANAQ